MTSSGRSREHFVPETRVLIIRDIYKAKDMPHVDPLDCGALLVQQLGDCHEHRCLKEWYPQANNITVTKYAFELPELFNLANVRKVYPNFEMGLFGHSPDTANEWDFYPLPWGERTAKAVIFGFDGGFYPVRTTVTDHLRRLEREQSLHLSPISRHPHPGYQVDTTEEYRQHPLETYEIGHASYSRHRALREDFAKGMRQAQICLFDSSLERKLIRKYAQAMLSGCVIASDLPTEHEEAMEAFTIRLHPSWKIERIEEEINKYLAQPEKLQQMALDAFAYARRHLTTTAKVTDMLRLAEAHRSGARGYDRESSQGSPCGKRRGLQQRARGRLGVERQHEQEPGVCGLRSAAKNDPNAVELSEDYVGCWGGAFMTLPILSHRLLALDEPLDIVVHC